MKSIIGRNTTVVTTTVTTVKTTVKDTEQFTQILDGQRPCHEDCRIADGFDSDGYDKYGYDK